MRGEAVEEGVSVSANTGARSRHLGGSCELQNDMTEAMPLHLRLRVFPGVLIGP